MRAVTTFSPQLTSFSAATMLSRALSSSAGATASSRSRQTTSAALAAAFSNKAGRDPGTNSLDRYSRGGTRRSTGVKLTRFAPKNGQASPTGAFGSSALLRLRQRVGGFHHLAKPLACHMRVNLCGGDVGMAEHSLHAAQIGAAFDQMRRKSVAQDVRRKLGGIETSLQRNLLQHLMTAAPREMAFCAARRKQIFVLARAARKQFVPHLQVIANRGTRRRVQRYQPLLLSLALHQQQAVAIARHGKRQHHQLRNTQARRIENFQ